MVNGLSCDLEVWSKALFKELVRLRRYMLEKRESVWIWKESKEIVRRVKGKYCGLILMRLSDIRGYVEI